MIRHRDDPILAIATPAGRGGIGVVRLSFGRWSRQPVVADFIAALCGKPADFRLVPRHATMVAVRAADGAAIDRGIALLFDAPHSYTGDDVVELQLHGGPTLLRMVVARCLAVATELERDDGSATPLRLAEPGEFTERAFLNDRLDLAQAEAVADLIEAGSEAAVLGAQASLSGAFSNAVRALVDQVIELRALVEATLDFPEEEIDFLEQSDARGRLERIVDAMDALMERARQGALLREGLTVVLVGRPNVGKSSLLNALAEAEVAIVTPIAGTTRDRVEQVIRLEGIALHVVDTAGIRELDDDLESATDADAVERIGIARTWEAIAHAHVVLHLVDAASIGDADRDEDLTIARRLPPHAARRIVVNKIDLTGDEARVEPAIDRVIDDGIGLDGPAGARRGSDDDARRGSHDPAHRGSDDDATGGSRDDPHGRSRDDWHGRSREDARGGSSGTSHPDAHRSSSDDALADAAIHAHGRAHGIAGTPRLYLSAKTGAGIDLLRHELLAIAGWQPSGESGFSARERHLSALRAATTHLDAAAAHAAEGDRQLDLFAEELRLAQVELDRITGVFTADDLLGEIFGRFCIGK